MIGAFRPLIVLAAMVAASTAGADITRAGFGDATTRYNHGVLGQGAEWGSLTMMRDDGKRLRVVLDQDHVFEDIEPRVADLDGDGEREVLVVETDRNRGARLMVYTDAGKVAAGPHIGTPFRWLAIVGTGDLDGDGKPEIAYVETPHLKPVLKIAQFRDGVISPMVTVDGKPVAPLRGVTNHVKGDAFLQGGIADCGNGPSIFVADPRWTKVLEVRLERAELKSRVVGEYKGPVSLADAVACR